ncbi:MAG: hypothetical protein M0Q91_12630 [Methanoregula sp.]|jgi:hypothetical protein|nr:hypothetical protein [Methanoregula sp.]
MSDGITDDERMKQAAIERYAKKYEMEVALMKAEVSVTDDSYSLCRALDLIEGIVKENEFKYKQSEFKTISVVSSFKILLKIDEIRSGIRNNNSTAEKRGIPKYLDQALNEGDGVYRP